MLIISIFSYIDSDASLSRVLNPLSDNKLLDWSKFKQIADKILKCI